MKKNTSNNNIVFELRKSNKFFKKELDKVKERNNELRNDKEILNNEKHKLEKHIKQLNTIIDGYKKEVEMLYEIINNQE